MASNDEYQQRRTFEDRNKISPGNGWVTVTAPDGMTHVYNERVWNEILYGDVSKLIDNKQKQS